VPDPEPFVPDPEPFVPDPELFLLAPALFVHLIVEKEKEEVLREVPFFSLYD
jgi:hypothetical protein